MQNSTGYGSHCFKQNYLEYEVLERGQSPRDFSDYIRAGLEISISNR